jgi:hypothetical protein
VSGIGDRFNGRVDEFRIAHVRRRRLDRWIATTWKNMSDPGAFAAAGAEEQKDGERWWLAGAGVVVCLMARGGAVGADRVTNWLAPGRESVLHNRSSAPVHSPGRLPPRPPPRLRGSAGSA